MTKNKQKNKIPDGWEVKKLEEISKIYDGTHQTPKYVNKGIHFLSVEHITANQFFDTKFISEDIYNKEIERVKIESGDVLMTRIGDIGTAKYISWDIKASFYVTLALLKTFDEGVNNKFLTYLINSQESQREIWKKTIHVAFPNKINLGDIGKCKMTFPPLPEQKRIVGVLEAWDEGIEKLGRKIEIKENIKKGIASQIMNCELSIDEQIVNGELLIVKKYEPKLRLPGFSGEWKEKKLGEIVDFWNGKGHEKDISKNGKYIVVNSKFISSDGMIKKFSNEQKAPLKKEDVTMVMSDVPNGKAIAKTFLIDKDKKYTLNQRIGGFKSEKIQSRFLQNLLNRNRYFLSFDDGVSQTNLRKDDILACKLIFPSSKEQKAIAEVLTTADEEIEMLRKKLEILKEQKRFLLNNLISGTIRVPEKV